MDDHTTATHSWLTLSLGVPKATRFCQKLREDVPDPIALGKLLSNELHVSLRRKPAGPAALLSDEILASLASPDIQSKVDGALTWKNNSTHHHLLGLDHPTYPELLKNTSDAPPILYAKGSLAALDRPLLAVVGSRKASRSALEHTRQLCAQLASVGIGIVSGLATGVDAAAHRGALEGNGVTIAVLGTEPDRIYPTRHKGLASEIIDKGGLLMTEYPIGSVTRPWHFPQRNRIISGISLGVLVVEAALPSGSLTTARHAMNQGREVMAVPGSIHNLYARGCHELIKQGAALVENTKDVVEALGNPLQRLLLDDESPNNVSKKRTQTPTAATAINRALPLFTDHANQEEQELDENERWALVQLAAQPASIDELMTLAHKNSVRITISTLVTLLGRLEIRGLISTEAGGRYARC